MDERLQSILDSVQKTANQIGNSASDAAYGVSARASQLLSVGKLNIRLVDLRAEVNLHLREIGELVYATHTGDPTDSEVLLGKLQVIDQLNAQIAEVNAQLALAKGVSLCPRCGAAARAGDAFCRECGEKF